MALKFTRPRFVSTREIPAPSDPCDAFKTDVEACRQRFRSRPVTPQSSLEFENGLQALRWTPLFGQKKALPKLHFCQPSSPATLACSCSAEPLVVSTSRRVKRRLALLASIQPRDNSAEGTPMALGSGSVSRSGAS